MEKRTKTNLFLLLISLVCMTSCGQKNKDTWGYSGDDLEERVWLERNDSNQLYFRTIIPGKWEVYQIESLDSMRLSAALLSENMPGEYLLSRDNSVRKYFQVNTPLGNGIMAEKQLPLVGSYNFRDMGGIRNRDGKYVKWGKVFRSDDLSDLTEADRTYLASIPLVTVVDFRSDSEIEQNQDNLPATVRNIYQLSIEPGNLNVVTPEQLAGFTEEQGDSIMKEINRELITDSESIQQYKTFFDLLENPDNLPLVFHCTAGKDRTGMAAYLFLSALNVDDSIIMDDYLLSNAYLGDKYRPLVEMYPFLQPLMVVRSAYIQAGIYEIITRYGSVETYLIEVLGVNPDKMKQLYLY